MKQAFWKKAGKRAAIFAVFVISLLFLSKADDVKADVADIQKLQIGGVNIVLDGQFTGNSLPAGVTYDSAANILSLTDSTIRFAFSDRDSVFHGINYQGSRDLNIVATGTNTIIADKNFGTGISVAGGASLRISGGGTIIMQNTSGAIVTAGSLEIDHVKIVVGDAKYDTTTGSNGAGIGGWGGVTIKNSEIQILGTAWKSYGINALEGTLSVENSTIEMKNCIVVFCAANVSMPGAYFYTGKGKAEKAASLEKAVVKRITFDYVSEVGEYFLVSPVKISLEGDKPAQSTETAALKTPALSGVTNQASGITVKWKKVSGADGYYVYRKSGKGAWKKVGTVKGASGVSYTDKTVKSKNGTTYVYTVKAYKGKATSSYNKTGLKIVRLTAPSISKLTNKKTKKLTVAWKKNAKASGYQIQYSVNAKFKNAEQKKVTSAGKTSLTLGGLKKKTYYVRLRSYKKSGKKTYYSAWSSAKKIKIMK